MTTRVEGTVALKFHGFVNADVAARAFADALDDARTIWFDEDEADGETPRDVEVVQVQFYQVVESEPVANQTGYLAVDAANNAA